ncbi:MAG TPA: glycosyltransferase, partial [Pseudolabrys sp.]
MLVLSIVLLVVIVWLIGHALRQRYALSRLSAAAPGSPADGPRVAIIVPARDESANIGACLAALLAQDYPRLAIVVVDDESTDDTAAIVRRLSTQDRRIVLMQSPPLPPGWTGKVNACAAGARAVADAAEWLCFVDADIRAQPALIASAIGAASREAIDLLTLAPRQELQSFAERLVLPCGFYLLSFSQNLARMQAADSDDAAATGQFMLIRRAAYEDVGGHAAVSRSIVEDLDLARLMKRRGHRVLMQDATALMSVRTYTDWATLWPGLARTLVDLLGGPTATLVTTAAGVTLAWAIVLIPAFDLAGCAAGTQNACLAAVPAL